MKTPFFESLNIKITFKLTSLIMSLSAPSFLLIDFV